MATLAIKAGPTSSPQSNLSNHSVKKVTKSNNERYIIHLASIPKYNKNQQFMSKQVATLQKWGTLTA